MNPRFPQVQRAFVGMNPKIKESDLLRQFNVGQQPFIFDSDFESGNLDMVVQTQSRDF